MARQRLCFWGVLSPRLRFTVICRLARGGWGIACVHDCRLASFTQLRRLHRAMTLNKTDVYIKILIIMTSFLRIFNRCQNTILRCAEAKKLSSPLKVNGLNGVWSDISVNKCFRNTYYTYICIALSHWKVLSARLIFSAPTRHELSHKAARRARGKNIEIGRGGENRTTRQFSRRRRGANGASVYGTP